MLPLRSLGGRLASSMRGWAGARPKLRPKISAYLCIYNDWDILPQTLQCIAPYIDELVVVDGAYRWMAPFLEGIARNLARSENAVFECLAASRIPYRVLSGVWDDEWQKRTAGYLACRHRYRLRVDADEIYFFDATAIEEFLRCGAAVGNMAFPPYVAPGWVLSDNPEPAAWEHQSFFFDAQQISGEDHLRYLWLVDVVKRDARDYPPVFDRLLAFTAHLTMWRTPTTSANRAAFYTLNWIRHNGAPWYPDLASRPLSDLGAFFARMAPRIYYETMRNHGLAVGDPSFEMALKRVPKASPLTAGEESTFTFLYDRYRRSQAQLNEELATDGRYALEPVNIDLSAEETADAVARNGELVLEYTDRLVGATASIRYLIGEAPWVIERQLLPELDANQLKIDIRGGNEPAYLRRHLKFAAYPATGEPLTRLRRI